MTRSEHMRWCKRRALEELEFSGKPADGIVSMMSDLREHPDTNQPSLMALCMGMLPILRTKREVVEFINGFAE